MGPVKIIIQIGPLTVAQVKAVLADTKFSCMAKPDTDLCRRILAPNGFLRGPQIDHFQIKAT